MTTKHTPTPWYVDYKGDGAITGKDGELIGRLNNYIDYELRKADATFIVRACNAHDDLVAANENLRSRIRIAYSGLIEASHHLRAANLNDEADAVDAALRKARGE